MGFEAYLHCGCLEHGFLRLRCDKFSLSSTGKVVYPLKTQYLDGTTQVAYDRGGHCRCQFMPE